MELRKLLKIQSVIKSCNDSNQVLSVRSWLKSLKMTELQRSEFNLQLSVHRNKLFNKMLKRHIIPRRSDYLLNALLSVKNESE